MLVRYRGPRCDRDTDAARPARLARQAFGYDAEKHGWHANRRADAGAVMHEIEDVEEPAATDDIGDVD